VLGAPILYEQNALVADRSYFALSVVSNCFF